MVARTTHRYPEIRLTFPNIYANLLPNAMRRIYNAPHIFLLADRNQLLPRQHASRITNDCVNDGDHFLVRLAGDRAEMRSELLSDDGVGDGEGESNDRESRIGW